MQAAVARRTVIGLGLFLALAALSLAACGGGSEEPGAPAVSEGPQSNDPVAEPEAAAPPPEGPAPDVPLDDAGAAPLPPLPDTRAGVPVDRKTIGLEGATVEIIDFGDFQ